MAGTFPRFRLYQSDGSTLVYNFENTISINDFQDPSTFVEHTSLRGQGSIITEGTNEPWDLNLEFVIISTDYETLVALINALPTTIAKFTKYILKVELTSGGSTKDYKVMRLNSITFPLVNAKKRVTFQTTNIQLRVDTWV